MRTNNTKKRIWNIDKGAGDQEKIIFHELYLKPS